MRLSNAAAAVVGSPISHSLSPVLHRAAYADLGLPDWTYDAIEVPAGTLAERCVRFSRDGIGGRPCAGLSVTMPLKLEALALAERADHLAEQLGAANTLVPITPSGGWAAYNTDVDGLVGAARELGVTSVDGASCLVIGAGGTGVSALAALTRLGALEVQVLARDADRARSAMQVAGSLGLAATVHPWGEGGRLIATADLILSTVPRGATDGFGGVAFKSGSVLIDAVYNGGDALMMRAAQAQGVTAASGELMLLHQAVRQVELMTGARPAITAMRYALVALNRSA